MHYALNPRTFLFSHYFFYSGLRVAVGVIGLTLAVFAYSSLAGGDDGLYRRAMHQPDGSAEPAASQIQ
ncbi:hypothetical protein ACFS07_18930 [Undibacterium arcticum]